MRGKFDYVQMVSRPNELHGIFRRGGRALQRVEAVELLGRTIGYKQGRENSSKGWMISSPADTDQTLERARLLFFASVQLRFKRPCA